MAGLKDEIEEADELLQEAEGKLSAAAREVELVAREHSALSEHHDIEENTITVSVNHRKTVKKLNEQLPYPYYAKKSRGSIEIVEMEVDVDSEEMHNLKQLINAIEEEFEDGAPEKAVIRHASGLGYDKKKAELELDKLRQKGEIYEPNRGRLRTT